MTGGGDCEWLTAGSTNGGARREDFFFYSIEPTICHCIKIFFVSLVQKLSFVFTFLLHFFATASWCDKKYITFTRPGALLSWTVGGSRALKGRFPAAIAPQQKNRTLAPPLPVNSAPEAGLIAEARAAWGVTGTWPKAGKSPRSRLSLAVGRSPWHLCPLLAVYNRREETCTRSLAPVCCRENARRKTETPWVVCNSSSPHGGRHERPQNKMFAHFCLDKIILFSNLKTSLRITCHYRRFKIIICCKF